MPFARYAGTVRVPLFDYADTPATISTTDFNEWSTRAAFSRSNITSAGALPVSLGVAVLDIAGIATLTEGAPPNGQTNSAYLDGEWSYVGGNATKTISVTPYPREVGDYAFQHVYSSYTKNWGGAYATEAPCLYKDGPAMVAWYAVSMADPPFSVALWQTIQYASGALVAGARISIADGDSFIPGISTPINFVYTDPKTDIKTNFTWMPSDQPRGSLFIYEETGFIDPGIGVVPVELWFQALHGVRDNGLYFEDPVLDLAFITGTGVKSGLSRIGFSMIFRFVPHNAQQTFTFIIFRPDMLYYWKIEFDAKTAGAAAGLRNPLKLVCTCKQDTNGVFYARMDDKLFTSFTPDVNWNPSILPIPHATYGLPCFDPCIDDYWSDPHV